MSKTVAFFLLFLFPVFNLKPQKTIFDKSRYQNLMGLRDDTTKVLAYLTYGALFENAFPDSAEYYYKKSEALSFKLNYKRGLAIYISYEIVLLNNKGKYTDALALCQKAIPIYENLKSPRNLAIAYNNLGNEFQYLGALKEAVKNYLIAAGLAEKIKEYNLLRPFTNNVASIFISLQEYEKGYKYAQQSYNLAKISKDSFGIASSLVNLALANMHQGQNSLAAQELLQVYNFSNLLHDYTLALDSYNNLGAIALKEKRYPLALSYFQSALDTALKYNNPIYVLEASQGMAESYMGQGRWNPAGIYILKAIKIAQQIKARNELADLYSKASKINEGLHDYKAALYFNKHYQELNDTLLNEKIRSDINEMDVQYQTIKKDKALADQNLVLEKKEILLRNRNIWLFLLLGGVILLILIIILAFRFYQQRQVLSLQTIKALQKEQEVVRLRALMEGQDQERNRISKEMHDDVGSGLTSILYLSDSLKESAGNSNIQTVAKISNTANSLVDKLNEIIWSMNKGFDSLDDLIFYLRHSIGELLEASKIAYDISIPEKMPAISMSGEQRRNIYLVVKETIHNIMKHSFATLVSIEFRIENGLLIMIQDNGRGIDINKLRQFGNGLKNMQQRMDNIGGNIEISRNNGTRVEIKLPLNL